MDTQIFVNISTKDLERAKTFYQAIGFTLNPQFTDENACAVVINDSIYVMILVEKFFQQFLPNKTITDTSKSAETLNSLSVHSKEEVDAFLVRVLAAGGKEYREANDMGFMYGRAFEDLDGHIWEIFWMDPAHLQEQK